MLYNKNVPPPPTNPKTVPTALNYLCKSQARIPETVAQFVLSHIIHEFNTAIDDLMGYEFWTQRCQSVQSNALTTTL